MSDLLQTIKDQVLQEYRADLRLGKLSWEDASVTVQNILWPEVCNRCAIESGKIAYNQAIEDAKTKLHNLRFELGIEVIKEAIDRINYLKK